MLNINQQSQNFQINPSFRAGTGNTCFFPIEKSRIQVRNALKNIGYGGLIEDWHISLYRAIIEDAPSDIIDGIVRIIDAYSLKSENAIKIKRQTLADLMKNCSDYIGEVYGAEQKSHFQILSDKFLKKLYGGNAAKITKVKKKMNPNINLYIATEVQINYNIKDKVVRKRGLQNKVDKHFDLMNFIWSILHNDRVVDIK